VLQSLTSDEASWFQQMNFKQPHFGGLPFVLLVDRFSFLRGPVWELWSNPADPAPIGVLHRLLDYYEQMATRRRELDRLMKDKQASRVSPRLSVECSLTPIQDWHLKAAVKDSDGAGRGKELALCVTESEERNSQYLFGKLAEQVRSAAGIRCSCSLPQWDARVEDPATDPVTITHYCVQCGVSRVTSLTLDQLGQIVSHRLD
jgi:hypothetical protein